MGPLGTVPTVVACGRFASRTSAFGPFDTFGPNR